jgi:outer membrane biosynthesis protein TonB
MATKDKKKLERERKEIERKEKKKLEKELKEKAKEEKRKEKEKEKAERAKKGKEKEKKTPGLAVPSKSEDGSGGGDDLPHTVHTPPHHLSLSLYASFLFPWVHLALLCILWPSSLAVLFLWF